MVFLKNKISCPRTRDRKATEAALLKAASELFAEKGYENTRTLEIAKAAGANEALITRYFGGKEGLLTAILMDEAALQTIMSGKSTCVEKLPKSDEQKSLCEAILEYFRLGEEAARTKEQSMRIATSRALVDPKMADVVRDRIADQVHGEMLESLKTHLKGSRVPKEDLEAVIMLLASNNFILNFMGKRVYRMNAKRLNRAQEILASALEAYLK